MADIIGVQVHLDAPLTLRHTTPETMTLQAGNYIATAVRPSDKGAEYALHLADEDWNASGERLANVGLTFDGKGNVEIS